MKKLIVFASICFAGCATRPVSDRDAEHVMAPAFAQTDEANTVIVVTRDSGLANGGATARIFIDGREAASLRPSQQARIYLAAGEHIVGVGQNSANVQAATGTVTRIERERRFRISAEPGKFSIIPQ
jgi:hypothetical protein